MNILLSLWTAVTITFFHPDLHGNNMANGKPYNKYDTTICASNDYPLETILAIYTENNLTFCIVSDRMAYGIRNRLDSSEGAFSLHAPLDRGVVRGKVTKWPIKQSLD